MSEQDEKRYHHGDLREALILEAQRQIAAHGVEAFKISECCRALGVSTAAPYRHFPDREALIDAVCAAGFAALTAATRAARDAAGPDPLDALTAIGQTYVRFAAETPEMFHLMWGATRDSTPHALAQEAGAASYGVLIEAIDAVKAEHGLGDTPSEQIALPLWATVHGLASLKLSRKLELKFGRMDDAAIDAVVAFTTRAVIARFAASRG